MAAPTVTSINPQAGSIYGGTSVVITGTNLNVAGTAVFFGDLPAASFVVDSATQITAVSPLVSNEKEADVYVSTNDGVSDVPPSARFYYFNPIASPYYLGKNVFFDPEASYVFYGDVVFAKDPLFASSPGGGSGPVSGATNLGAGAGLFVSELAGVLRFKSITAGSGITLTPSGTELEISAAAASADWTLAGNTGAGNVLGSTDAQGYSFIASGTPWATVGATGAFDVLSSSSFSGATFTVNGTGASSITADTISLSGTGGNTLPNTSNVRIHSAAGNVRVESEVGELTLLGGSEAFMSSNTTQVSANNVLYLGDDNVSPDIQIVLTKPADSMAFLANGGFNFVGSELNAVISGNIQLDATGTFTMTAAGAGYVMNGVAAGTPVVAASTNVPPAGFEILCVNPITGAVQRYSAT